jgi:2-(1,2-epoxy-1,2-dihydrophenyl)acetyl-CoA isomerase
MCLSITEIDAQVKPSVLVGRTLARVPDTILTERRGDVLLITLHRPEKLNAWTTRMGRELKTAISDANADAGIGAIVVTGAGRAFCAGADISDTFADRDVTTASSGAESAGANVAYEWVELCQRSKPLLAAVNGICIGVGVTQILCFDTILASEQARFGIGFIKIGLVPELAATRFLTERMGPGRARLFALSGDLWSADEALAANLVDRVVVHEDLVDEALEIAGRIAANPAPQLQWTKQLLIDNAIEPDLRTVQGREMDAIGRSFASPEHAEAVKAFVEKRPPAFPPRSAIS